MPKPKVSRRHYRRAKAETDASLFCLDSSNFSENARVLRENACNPSSSNISDRDKSINSTSCSNIVPELPESESELDFFETEFRVTSEENTLFENNNDSDAEVLPNLENLKDKSLASSLAEWAVKNRITHSALNSLLSILKPMHNELPLDSRTLLNTPRSITTKIVEPGSYFHFGLQKCIENLLCKHSSIETLNRVEIFINIDGLPLSKSSQSQVYPIQCCLAVNRNNVDMIGIYHGNEKPKDVNKFLEDFVNDANNCIKNGFYFKGHHYSFSIKGVSFVMFPQNPI